MAQAADGHPPQRCVIAGASTVPAQTVRSVPRVPGHARRAPARSNSSSSFPRYSLRSLDVSASLLRDTLSRTRRCHGMPRTGASHIRARTTSIPLRLRRAQLSSAPESRQVLRTHSRKRIRTDAHAFQLADSLSLSRAEPGQPAHSSADIDAVQPPHCA